MLIATINIKILFFFLPALRRMAGNKSKVDAMNAIKGPREPPELPNKMPNKKSSISKIFLQADPLCNKLYRDKVASINPTCEMLIGFRVGVSSLILNKSLNFRLEINSNGKVIRTLTHVNNSNQKI